MMLGDGGGLKEKLLEKLLSLFSEMPDKEDESDAKSGDLEELLGKGEGEHPKGAGVEIMGIGAKPLDDKEKC